MNKFIWLFFAVFAFVPFAQALVTKDQVSDFNDLQDLTIICDGREVNTGKYDDDIRIYRVSTESQIKYEVYSKDSNQLILACDNIGLN